MSHEPQEFMFSTTISSQAKVNYVRILEHYENMLPEAFDHKLHEFDRGEAGVHCSPVSSPDLPGDAFKSEAHRFATHCHMQIEGEPV